MPESILAHIDISTEENVRHVKRAINDLRKPQHRRIMIYKFPKWFSHDVNPNHHPHFDEKETEEAIHAVLTLLAERGHITLEPQHTENVV